MYILFTDNNNQRHFSQYILDPKTLNLCQQHNDIH